MGEDDREGAQPLARIARVRCLGCGSTYIKPSARGTTDSNPGCPECGYVGWVVEQPRPSAVSQDAAHRRFAGDHRRRRIG